MQVSQVDEGSRAMQRASTAPLPRRRTGTIPVTVCLDPPRYDRLKRPVLRLSTTGQSIMQTALDRSLPGLERERAQPAAVTGQQTSLFVAPAVVGTASRLSVRPRSSCRIAEPSHHQSD